MKKSILRHVGIMLVAVSALLLGACKQEPLDERDSFIDTYSLDGIDIKAKAYPGFNYISWGVSLDSDTDYDIYRDDGKYISPTEDHYAIDSDIKDGVTYTYTIYTYWDQDEAIKGADSTGNNSYYTYYTVKGNSKSASVTAIKPDFINDKGEFLTALDLVNYETNGNKKYVISKENLRFKINGTTLRIAFPTKAYLKYSLNIYRGNSYDVFGPGKMPSTDTTSTDIDIELAPNYYKMDDTYSNAFTTLSAGTYQAVITVDGFGDYETSYIVSDPITIEALDTSVKTKIDSYGYIDDGNTIRISWEPAKDSAGNVWGTENYTVYLKDSNYVYTDIEATINEDVKSGKTIYYAEYDVPDNTVNYDFYVVLSDGDKVENNSGVGNAKTCTVSSYGVLDWAAKEYSVDSYFRDLDDTDVYNDAWLSIVVPDAGVTVSSVKYKVIPMNTNTDGSGKLIGSILYNDSELETAAVVPVDYLNYAVSVKNVPLGSKVLFIYTLKEAGKKDYVGRITTGCSWCDDNNDGDYDDVDDYASYDESYAAVAEPSINGEFNFEFTNTDGFANTGKFSVIAAYDEDSYSNYANYKYEIYYARLLNGESVKDIQGITTAWTAVPVEIAWNVDDYQYNGVSEEIEFTVDTPIYDVDLESEEGSKVIIGYEAEYVFKFVKTNKNVPAGTEGASKTIYIPAANFNGDDLMSKGI